MLIKQSTSTKAIPFYLVSSTDHIAPKTGLAPTVTISKNGAAFGSPAGAVTEIGSGWYKIAANATDSNTVGSLLVHATGTGADPFDVEHEVVEATLAKGTDITGFNDISAANIQTELTTYGALKPTAAGRTLDVSTGGEAGLDWANIGAPTTTQNLSATTISTSQTVATVTNGVSLTSGERTTLAGVIWNILTSTLTTVGSIGKLLVDNVNATISSRSTYAGTDTPGTTTLLARVPTDPADASDIAASFTTVNGKLDAIDNFVDTEVGAIKTTTDKLDTALEIDGAVWRYTVNALENAPAGGGGGATDWTTAEKDQIRYRLGIDGDFSAPAATPSLASQTTALAIKTKTDALPTDPADASDIATSFTTVNTKLDAIDDFVDTEITAIKAKTDALPADPADASDIAASFTTLNTKVDTIDDFLDTEVSAIKSKTDNLPTDPADASDIAASFVTVNGKLDAINGSVDTEVGAIKTVTDKLNTALEVDGPVWRYTTNALEQAPSGSASDMWAVLVPGAYGAGTAGKILGTNLDATVSSRMPTSSYVAPANADITAIKAKTDNLPAQPAAVSNIPTAAQNAAATRDVSNAGPPVGSLGADVKSGISAAVDPAAIADEVLKRDWNLISGEANYSVLNALRFLRDRWEVLPDGTLKVYKQNGTDIAWQRTVTIDPLAEPITAVS